ncbi:hypothetical protein [Streptomyces sp. BH104]|uniref:hypothetical protein n=1 Tax=Streptomyces sp. BH104 TaxID=3410407 RepID=UPI003BB73966
MKAAATYAVFAAASSGVAYAVNKCRKHMVDKKLAGRVAELEAEDGPAGSAQQPDEIEAAPTPRPDRVRAGDEG